MLQHTLYVVRRGWGKYVYSRDTNDRKVIVPKGVGLCCGFLTCVILLVGCPGLNSEWGAGVARAACSANTEKAREAQASVRSVLAPSLPDCRAYEQVSPVDKNHIDAAGGANRTVAAPNGNGVAYFAVAPFSGTKGSAQAPSYISLRSLGEPEWTTQGEEALESPGAKEHLIGVTSDLRWSSVLVGSEQSDPSCDPQVIVCAVPGNASAYVRNNVTGEFQFIAQLGLYEFGYTDASEDDSRVLFETEAELTPQAATGVNLYEWNEAKPQGEQVSLVGALSSGEAPRQGAFAGPGGPAALRTPPLANKWHFYTQNTISADGSRVFFTSVATGRIYMREPAIGKTVQISGTSERDLREVEEGPGKPVETEPAFWQAATRTGSYIFYTEGNELYRFNVERYKASAQSEDVALEEAREQLTTGAEGVGAGSEGGGVLGISEEGGSYVYFEAPGVLASNTNGNNEKAAKGMSNLYEWHDGVVTFITSLANSSDWRDWTNEVNEAQGPSGGARSSRVTPDGKYLLFSSNEKVTSYNNNGFTEFYLYYAEQPLASDNPKCISCNPGGSPATAGAHLSNAAIELLTKTFSLNAFVTHNLSDDGRRVFFETEESLIPGDGNKQDDVYEWEADGVGSCGSEAQDGGCLYLISTGQSTSRSSFGDASANGNDVFFFTRQSLVNQDRDNNTDLYDARVEGGIPSQNQPESVSPCAQEGGEATCLGTLSGEAATSERPASTTFSTPGNFIQSPSLPGPSLTHVETRAEKLAKALRACKEKQRRAKRKSCEKAAHARFGPVRQKVRSEGRRR